jgi:hypothetical protein
MPVLAEWAKEQKAERPDLDDGKLAAFGRNMWGGDLVFSVSREFCRRCTVPAFLPLPPGLEVLEHWRDPDHLDERLRRVLALLDRHTPQQTRKAA